MVKVLLLFCLVLLFSCSFSKIARKGSPDRIERALIAGADPSMRDEDGMTANATALMYAALQNENPDVIRLPLDSGADVNEWDKKPGAIWDDAACESLAANARILLGQRGRIFRAWCRPGVLQSHTCRANQIPHAPQYFS